MRFAKLIGIGNKLIGIGNSDLVVGALIGKRVICGIINKNLLCDGDNRREVRCG
jgi:hypothetical protein